MVKFNFTTAEREETLAIYGKLRELIGPSLQPGDEEKMRAHLMNCIEANQVQRDVFGNNPILQGFQTALIVVEEIGLKRDAVLSILLHPVMVPLQRQFLLSMMGGVALKMALANYTDDITLKWPNDVYWKDSKLSGTLIETTIAGGHINNCVFGIGLNVNQTEFHSDAPNPVSLIQILGHEVDRERLLREIIKAFKYCYSLVENGDYTDVAALYHDSLYRKHGFHAYRDKDGEFEAAIVEVEDNGHLILRDHEGAMREYAFKEVRFIS